MFDDFSAFKEEVKNRVDIIDVIGEFVELKKRGSNYLGLCPFHTEKTPSFSVNRIGQFYHCFGCGKGGDSISFLIDITGMSFMEAMEQLAERAGLKMPEKQKEDTRHREQKDMLKMTYLTAAEYFHQTLYKDSGKAGMDYLIGRGLTPETIRTFRLGYAPVNPSDFISFAKDKKVSISALEAAGILLPSKYSGPPYNRFGGRVIFPIIDQTARVIGFGARLLEGEGAKYINSSESLIYHKSRVLYGIYQAKASIKRTRKAVVVEGYMDVISLHQVGITNIIAASGTAFTVEQGRILARMSREVTLLFDGDPAGLTAAARSADNLIETDLAISVVVLPEGHDPDSYLRESGVESLREVLDKPVDIWEFKLQELKREQATVEDRIKLAGKVADSISRIPDDLKRDLYIRDMALKIGIDIDSLRKAVYGRIKKRTVRKDVQSPGATTSVTSGERELMACFILYPNLARHFIEEAGSKPFSNPVITSIAEEIFHRIVEGLEITPSALLSALPDPQIQNMVASVAMIPLDENTAEQYIEDNIKHYKERELRADLAETSRLIAQETDMSKKSTYVKLQKEVYARLKMLNGNS